MSIQPCLSAPLCKLLLCMVLLLIAVQYMMSNSLNVYRHETLFFIHTNGGAPPSISWRHLNGNGSSNTNLTAFLLSNSTLSSGHSPEPTLYPTTVPCLNSTNKSEPNCSASTQLPSCPPIPRNLRGPVAIKSDVPPLEEIELLIHGLDPGGHYKPPNCQARNRVAIIIPYRDRAAQLNAFLYHMHPFLQRQQIEYGIIVVEQAGKGPFNRAMLLNIGFVESQKLHYYDCFIFHDIDLLPEDDRNLYTCPEQPRHMSVAVSTLKYKLPYKDLFGGVSALTLEQFKNVNGFSNVFWGWGGEDDDMANRLKYHNYHVSRYPANIARYKMLPHRRQPANPKRHEYLYNGNKRFNTDGLNSLHYQRQKLKLTKLYTLVVVELSSNR